MATYVGRDLSTDRKYLIIEDATSFGRHRTYRLAREWLSKRKITGVPVFTWTSSPQSIDVKADDDSRLIDLFDDYVYDGCPVSHLWILKEKDTSRVRYSQVINALSKMGVEETIDDFLEFLSGSN